MTRRIKGVAPLQAGKMLGVLYACMGLIFLPIFALAGLAGAFAQQNTTSSEYGRSAISAYRCDDVRIRNLHARLLRRVWLYLRRYFRRYFTTSLPAGSAASRSKSNN